jgi:branched-chain amino acid transport system ATP-binding protein
LADDLLRLEDVSSSYGHIEAIRGVSLAVGAGEIVCLIGANGAGKTTTLMTISGIRHATRGSIWFAGQRIDRLAPDKIVRLRIAHVPEGRRIFPFLSVEENLRIGAYSRADRGSLATDYERVYAIFPRLYERRKQSGGSLSGGEQQMLAIARGLMGGPRLLMLDEASLGLAPIMVEQIFDALKEINREGTSLLLVEQNAAAALEIAHRGYVLQNGEVVVGGPVEELLRSELVREAYLG